MGFPYARALVTGASGGIGHAFARKLAEKGCHLVLVARRENLLAGIAAGLRDEHGVGVEVIVADLARDKELRRVEERLSDPESVVDLLVNNAGAGRAGEFAGLAADDLTSELRLNVTAPMRLMHAAFSTMHPAGRGGVINVSSMTGSMPMPRSATYGAAKAFLTALSESVSIESAGYGVTVTSVEAGLTRTGFHEAAGIDVDGLPKIAWSAPDDVVRAALKAHARGRVSVVPGTMNRVQGAMMSWTPRPMARTMVKRMFNV